MGFFIALLAVFVFALVFSGNAQNVFAAGASAEKETISGIFSIIWGDSDISSGQPDQLYWLADSNGVYTRLLIDDQAQNMLGNVLKMNRQYVLVSGEMGVNAQDGNTPPEFAVSAIKLDPSKNDQADNNEVTAQATGNQPWVSLLCKFKDYSIEPHDQDYFQNMYSNTKPGLDHFWRDQSYNTLSIYGSIATAWVNLPYNKSYYIYDTNSDGNEDVDFYRITRDCTSAADPYVDFSIYAGINMMFNTTLNCNNGICWAWGGAWNLTLDGINKTWRTTWEPPWAYTDISVIQHEMGHGFGLPHSSGSYGYTYDNAWDVMSWDRYNCEDSTDPTYGCIGQNTIAYHKYLAGWIPPDQVYTVGYERGARITLDYLDSATSSNYRMIKIPIANSTTHFYTIEARRPSGYDIKLPGTAVIVHDVDTTRSIPAHIVDTDWNGYTDDSGAMFNSDHTFYDSGNRILASITDMTDNGFDIVVENGQGPVPLAPVDGTTLKQGTTQVTIKWAPPPSISSEQISKYGVWIMVHTDNENHIFTNTTTSKTSFVIKGLIPNAIFEWFVAPIYEDGTNGIRNGLQFSTPKTKAPALSSPGKNSKQTKSSPIKFSWSKPAGLPSSGYQYILQYGSDINFSSGTFVQLDELVKTSISLPIAKNTIPQQIYWRVKVMNVNGMDDFSDFSAPRLFYR